MRRVLYAALLFASGPITLHAEEPAAPGTMPVALPDTPASQVIENHSVPESPCCSVDAGPEALPWRTVWGLVGIRIIPDGLKTAPDGETYHPDFSIDLDFNFWLWRSQGLYVFSDARFWGEKPEYGDTNARDGFFGTSKRQFDLSGGVAWNYYDFWEARAYGYSMNNLNRGDNPITPSGVVDGFGVENRYYLSSEYADLGKTGFDVARATFLSIGYLPSKDMVGNDGKSFEPGLTLRAYLTCDLFHPSYYAFADVNYIGDNSFQAKLLLFDVGLAGRPFHRCQQCEFRLGSENTADFQVRDVQSTLYASVRLIF